MKLLPKHLFLVAAFSLFLSVQNLLAQTPNASLQSLVVELNTLESQLASVQVTADAVCTPLLEANQAVRSAADAIVAVDENLAAPLQVDADTYDTLEQMFAASLSLSTEAVRLSLDVQQLENSVSPLTIKDGITAMLQLSDEIGTMADRIGEMADRILLMADNIDTMADRILQTQEIQSQNLVATMQNLLQAQTNMLTLVSAIETYTRSLQFETLYTDGMALYYKMQSVILRPWTMKYQLRSVVEEVQDYRAQVAALEAAVNSDVSAGTFYVDGSTLTKYYDLTVMLSFIAVAVDGYAVAINGLQAITSTSTLRDSMKSMLQLSSDIGMMADRIGEMGDTILVMADNIGMVADDIVAMQQFQSANILGVQQSVLATQQMVIAVTIAEGL